MADTPRTISYLTGTAFPAGSVYNAQNMRDFVVTTAARSFESAIAYAGVDPTGTTDSTTGLTNLIASGQSMIMITDGTYLTTGLTLGNANQTLVMTPGCTLKMKAGSSSTVITIAANGVTVTGGTVEGNSANVTSSAGIEIFGGGVSDVVVQGVTVQNTTAYGIHGNHTQRARIVGNKVFNTGGIGIFLQATTTSEVILDNVIAGNHVDRTARGTGITEGGIKVHADGTSANAQGTKILGNTVLMPGSPTDGSAICIEVEFANNDTVIGDNVTRGGGMGISLDTGMACSVTGNTVYAAQVYGIELAGCTRCTCTGNGIEGNAVCGNGIQLDDNNGSGINDGNTVSGNSIKGCINAAIKCYKANNAALEGNTSLLALASKQVIYLQNCSRTSITGGFLDGGNVSACCILLLDCWGINISGVSMDGAGTNYVLLETDTAYAIDNIMMEGCSLAAAVAVYGTSLGGGGSIGNNVAAMNCTGVVGQNTTNGNSRRGSCLDWKNQVWDFIGSGTPATSVTGGPGSIYRNQAGGATTTLYVKESGTGNTGWVAK